MNTKFTRNIFLEVNKHYLIWVVVFVLSLIGPLGFAQVSTYTYAESVSSYTPLSAPSIAYAAPWDDHVNGAAFSAPLGFTFNYDGNAQTDCFISPNGFVSFGVQPASTLMLPLSVATPFNGGGTISALGMDLISGTPTDNVAYTTMGSAPNRIFVVEWTNARRKVAAGNFNFQIRLHETTNAIDIVYGACAPADPAAYNAQVGLRGVTNDFLQGDVNNRFQTGTNVNSPWLGKTISGTANSNTVRTSATEYPNTGLKYSYTPSIACTVPTGLPSNFIIGSTAVTASSFVGNGFTANAPFPTNYLIVRSTVNTPPTNSDLPNRTYWAVNDVISGTYTVISNSNSTSFTQTGLNENTSYFYWVIPYNSGCAGGPFYNVSGMITSSSSTCISAPLGLVASSISGNSFTASWNTVPGASDYMVDVSTNTTFTALLPSYSNVSTAGLISISVGGLVPLTTYYFRVRASGINCNVNSAMVAVTTYCGSFPIPYFQNFDTTPVATVPTCFTISNNNSDSTAWQVQNSLASSAPNAIHLATNTPIDSDDFFYTPGLNLTAGVSYRVRFKYNTSSVGVFSENLRVRLGTDPSESSANSTLLDLPNLINTVYQTAIVDFIPTVSAVYYIGFQGYSFANQSKILLDDLSVIVSPTCFEPNDVTVISVGVTSATISWQAPTTAPSNGYQYYVSTSNVQPSGAVTPSGSVGAGSVTATITGLTAATLYYVWVRGNCSASDKSVWSLIQSFSTDCSVPALLTVVNGTLCGGGSTTLTATGASGSTIKWYSDSSATTLVGTGTSFVTPVLFAPTSYYAQSTAPGGLVTVGLISPLDPGGSLSAELTKASVTFSVATPTNLQSIDIYPIVSGQSGVFTIRNSANVILATYPYTTNVAGGNTVQTIPLGVSLPAGNFFLYTDVLPTAGLLVNSDNASYPYTSSVASITGNDYQNAYYMFAYNWKFSNVCESLPTEVKAIITPPPALSFSATTATICDGEITPSIAVIGAAAYTNFVWSPNTNIVGSVAAGFTFQPTVTTTYTLTASQTSGSLCTAPISLTVTVKPQPSAITILPASATLCQGDVQALNASLATPTPVLIYNETFNGMTNDWTTINNSVGGLASNAAWTLRDSPYTYSSPYWNLTLSSNDASRFYFSNSDAQGSPGSNRTITYLTSPSINLVGYTTATLNFYHYLRFQPGGKSWVEISTNGGTSWTLLTPFTASKGTPTNFDNVILNLTPYVGNNVKVRFYYDATWDYGWAIDNVSITGNLAIEVGWTPTTDLYFNAAATVPYIAGTPTSLVYAKPTSTITYTGTALGSSGCFTSNTSVLTVVPKPTVGVLSSSQDVCANWAPQALNLVGSVGTIAHWEYASDAAFTVGVTPIATTATTLTPVQIGSFTGIRYYRVVLQNGTCPALYSNAVYVSFYATTWDGLIWSNGPPNATTRAVFAGAYSSTGDLQACSVEVLSGIVTFNTSHTLTVQNDVKVTGGSLTFEDQSSLVQVNYLDNNGVAFTNTGNITYRRTTTPMFRFDYTYWSSPVSPQVLQGVSPTAPFGLFFWYNPAVNNWQYVNPSLTTMVSGRGYICRAPIDYPVGPPATPLAHTANFFGVPTTGLISLPIVGGASQFNLLGNPYPSALSADAFLLDAANAATLGGTIYLWTHNTPLNASFQYTGSDYAIYNYLGGVVGGVPTGASSNSGLNNSVPNGKIASGQGFFIKGLSNGTATFKNTMRIGGNNDQFFRMTSPNLVNTTSTELEKHRYWLNIENTQGAFKQALLGYVAEGTLGLDRLFDGEMIDIGNAITLYTVVDEVKLSIQGRPVPFDVLDTIPLGYKSTINSAYTISLFDFDGLFADQKIYLQDKELNIIHDLKNANYTFTTNIGTFDNRFVLRYTTETLSTTDLVFNENAVVIYKAEDGHFVLTSGDFIMDTVTVFDVRGRLLLKQKNINATTTRFIEGMTNQVLLVQIKTVDGVIVTKKVVR
jgi:hypothetical protein